jgi:hypothetical protein
MEKEKLEALMKEITDEIDILTKDEKFRKMIPAQIALIATQNVAKRRKYPQ